MPLSFTIRILFPLLVKLHFLLEPIDDALFVLLVVDAFIELLELVFLGDPAVGFQPVCVTKGVQGVVR